MDFEKLYQTALAHVNPRKLGKNGECGVVAAALECEDGSVYVGVNIDVPCSLGYCAEHGAIAAMVTAGKSQVVRMVAVRAGGAVIAPCGRCREFLSQINPDNIDCQVLLAGGNIAKLSVLLPERWDELL